MALRKCCQDSLDGKAPPCEECRFLLTSDAFSGVDARFETRPDRDPYELIREGYDVRKVEER